MPELPNRIDGEIIEAAHMNDATIRSVQRYTTAAQRDSLNPAPEEGQPAWISDVNELTFWTGTQWLAVGDGVFLPLAGGTITGLLGVSAPADHSGITVKAGGSSGSGGAIRFGASQADYFAQIEGRLNDGSNNSTGGLRFKSRASSGDTDLTTRFEILWDGRVVVSVAPVGSRVIRNILTGTGVPADSLGDDGDIYIRYS